MREWIYKTDATGRPRRFLSRREAAWWTVRRVGHLFPPALSGPILWTLFGPGSPGRWRAALPVTLAAACVWAVVAGTIYLYLVLSGRVMGRPSAVATAKTAAATRRVYSTT